MVSIVEHNASTATAGEFSRRARRTLEGVIGVPATEGNRIGALRNGDEIFPAMLEAIENAQRTIDFLTFVYWKGTVGTRFAKALCSRAKAGVRVRVLLDAWGAHPIERDLISEMRDAGVQVHWFRPLRRFRPREINHRTHRKVLIVDESIAFTGGVGISDLWQGDARNENEWRDTHFRIEGPAVDGLRAAFLDNWCETNRRLFDPSWDRFPDQPQLGDAVIQCVRSASEGGISYVSMLFHTMLDIAESHVRIATAYFVPDHDLTRSICEASERGVKVQILLPGPHADKRFVQLAGETDYGELLGSGVEIWNFQPSMLHAKIMTVDGVLANVGSANLNSRSMKCDEEINIVAIDPDLVRTLNEHFDEDLARSVQVKEVQWRKRTTFRRLAEHVVAPLRRLS